MLTRNLVEAMTPDLDPAVREAAWAYLEPVGKALAAPDLPVSPETAPAFAFDPVAAAGYPTPRPLPAPPPDVAPSPPPDGELAWLPAWQQAALVRAGRIRAEALVEAYAVRIERHQGTLNAYVTLTLDVARQGAGQPRPGPLCAVPVGVKDLMDTAGVRTTGGSRILADRVPADDAPVWRRMKAAGALLLGKLGTYEFASGGTGANPHFGQVRNPHDPSRDPGGSSAGSGAAVAAALCAVALGSDTGGSIRIPGACCGVVGLKPTYGRVATAGVLPLSWSLDHVGPLARTVRDAALVLDVIAGGAGAEDAARAGAVGDLTGFRIGVPAPWLAPGMEDGVRRRFDDALAVLSALGADVRQVAPDVEAAEVGPVASAILIAEAFSWHRPFLDQPATAQQYGEGLRVRREQGRLMLATAYLKAQRLRTGTCRRMARLWDGVDLLALPTLAVTAPLAGVSRFEPPGAQGERWLETVYGAGDVFNLVGAPAITVPCGLAPDGLPVGLALAAAPGADAVAVYAAAAFERATPHGRVRPAGAP